MTVENRWKSFALGFKNHHSQKLNIQMDNSYDEILRLQIIDLSKIVFYLASRDSCKLTQESIVTFSKLTLNNLSQLRLGMFEYMQTTIALKTRASRYFARKIIRV